MDHRQTSDQDQTAIKDGRARQKRLNYYWRVHFQQNQGSKVPTMWCFGQVKWSMYTTSYSDSQKHGGQILIHHWSSKIEQNQSPMSFKQQEPSDIWSRGTLSLQSSVWPVQLPQKAHKQLLWDAIVIGLWSTEAYFKYIEKGSNLTFNQAIEIAQNEEATSRKVRYMQPEFGSNTNKAVVNKLCGKGGGAMHNHKPQQGAPKEDPPIRTSPNPRRNPVIAVEQSHHIQEVNAQQRKPHATNVVKRNTIAVYADPRVKMSKSMRYTHSQWQHSTRTAFLRSTKQCILMLMLTPSTLQLSRAWTTPDLSH